MIKIKKLYAAPNNELQWNILKNTKLNQYIYKELNIYSANRCIKKFKKNLMSWIQVT